MCIHFLLLPHVQHLILLQTARKSFFLSNAKTSLLSISCRKHWHAEIVVTWTRLLKAHITFKYCWYSKKKCSDFPNNFVLKPNTFNGMTTILNYFCIHSPPIFSLVCRMKKKISTLGTGSIVAFFFFPPSDPRAKETAAIKVLATGAESGTENSELLGMPFSFKKEKKREGGGRIRISAGRTGEGSIYKKAVQSALPKKRFASAPHPHPCPSPSPPDWYFRFQNILDYLQYYFSWWYNATLYKSPFFVTVHHSISYVSDTK